MASWGEAYQLATVTDPLKLPSGSGGVNVSWDLHVTGGQTASNPNSTYGCQVGVYASSTNFGYTWWNVTTRYANCYVYAVIEVAGYAYLYDSTTGVYAYPWNWWGGIYNYTLIQNYTYDVAYNYSNSSYWFYNFTYYSGFNMTFGGPGSLNGTYAPQWFINGTFNAGDRYELTTYMFAYQESVATGFDGRGSGSTSINMASPGNHVNLARIATW